MTQVIASVDPTQKIEERISALVVEESTPKELAVFLLQLSVDVSTIKNNVTTAVSFLQRLKEKLTDETSENDLRRYAQFASARLRTFIEQMESLLKSQVARTMAFIPVFYEIVTQPTFVETLNIDLKFMALEYCILRLVLELLKNLKEDSGITIKMAIERFIRAESSLRSSSNSMLTKRWKTVHSLY
jgi:hypothetical protein